MDLGSEPPARSTQVGEEQTQTQLHFHLKRRIAHLHTLQEISCKLNSKLGLEDVLTSILDETIRAIGAERGCLLLANPATGDLEMRLTRHFHPPDLAGKSFRPSRTVIERVWCEEKPVLTANALEDPELAEADSVRNYVLRSILCVPLRLQGQKIGVLYLDNRLKAGQFQKDDLALAAAIADQAAIALHNAHLHQEAVDRAQKLMEVVQHVQSSNQISLKVQGLTDFPELFAVIGGELEQFGYHCAIALLNPDETCLEVRYVSFAGESGPDIPIPVDGVPCVSVAETTICRQVLATRQGRLVADLDEVMTELLRHPTNLACQSAFVAPLVANNRGIGLLILGLNRVHLEDPSLLMAFANQVATMIEMCRLHTQLQQRLAEIQSVLAITRALVSEVSLNNLLEFIMTQAEHLTNAEGAAVLLLDDDGRRLEVASPSEPWRHMKAGSGFPVQGSLAGLAIASQRVQISNQVEEDDRTASERAFLRSAELNSLLCAPLVAQSKSLGALLVWNKRERVFTSHDSRLMGLFADQAALALHNAWLYARNRQLAVEQERHRLAQELHDSVTQSLYSIALAAQTALKLLDQPDSGDKVRNPIEHILEFSQTALTEMREQLHNLYPTVLIDKGLIQALAEYCDELETQYTLSIKFMAGSEPPLSMVQRKTLYYIAREALWNVIKHAGATRIDVSLTTENGQVVLSVTDDGAGFDPLTVDREETIGLRSMEERTRLLGGIFELRSEPGHGTRVTSRIPIQAFER